MHFNAQATEVMQQGMNQDFGMTAERLHQEESAHAGSKRSSPPTVQSDDDSLFPTSPTTSTKIVQTTKSKGIVNVQLFIRKAFAMINECDPTIAGWTEEGDKFVVKNKDVFASTVIPQYYDHNNYSSFTRQLNFYGFTREQSMTIKVSDLNSLAVGQETFFHQNFQRGRPDLLKNLQRRSTDTKNSKKRKKPRTDGDVSFLQGRVEAMEETTNEMLAAMKQMREDSFASASAIRNLQNLNAAKDEKISALEKRIDWLERRLSTSAMQRQESYINSTATAQGLMKGWPQASGNAAASFAAAQSQAAMLSASGVSGFPNGSNLTTGAVEGTVPTLARHPKMKKYNNDIFSYENATNNGSNINFNQSVVPSRETSLDLGLLSTLARESSLMNWLPRQDNDKTLP